MTHRELAEKNFLAGYNCAQAVLLAFAEDLGLEAGLALRLSASFGGGMGRLREVCGALSAVLMAAGVLYGYDEPGDDRAKAAHYARVQELAGSFREACGSILCRELLGRAGAEAPVPEARTAAYYAGRPCAKIVGAAARILEEYMAEHPPEGRENPSTSKGIQEICHETGDSGV